MKTILYSFCWLMLLLPGIARGQAETVTLKVLSYNLRFGELASLEQLGTYIKSENPDIVMLQEVDVCTNRTRAPHQNGKNFISELAFYTGMLSAYGKSIDYAGGYYGIGLLSKVPFVSTERFLLPLVEQGREQRSLLIGRIDLGNNRHVNVACTHLDLKQEIQEIQVKTINDLLKKETCPVIVAGDFNSKPEEPQIREGMQEWLQACSNQLTCPAKEPKYKIDYIFAYPKSRWTVVSSRVADEAALSDHRPVVAILKITFSK